MSQSMFMKKSYLFFLIQINPDWFYPERLDSFSVTSHVLEPQLHQSEKIQVRVLDAAAIYP
jgi:hypothetical protein